MRRPYSCLEHDELWRGVTLGVLGNRLAHERADYRADGCGCQPTEDRGGGAAAATAVGIAQVDGEEDSPDTQQGSASDRTLQPVIRAGLHEEVRFEKRRGGVARKHWVSLNGSIEVEER